MAILPRIGTNVRTITVTDIDIKCGTKFKAYSDPLSMAFNRVFDETIGVGLNTWWSKEDHWTEYPLPEEARTFRRLFDEGKKVSPLMFEVDDSDYEIGACARRATEAGI